jgi:hypothetical protein
MKLLREIVKPYDNYPHVVNPQRDSHHDNIHMLHHRLSQHYEFKDNDHYNSIYSYTGSDFHSINGSLWQHHLNNGEVSNYDNIHLSDHQFHHTMKHLDSALKLHKTPTAFSVYSGIQHNFKPELNKNYYHPAYMSTSLQRNTAAASFNKRHEQTLPNGDFEEHTNTLHIRVPEGHPGAYAAHIAKYGSEKEFILPRGTMLRHRGTTTYAGEQQTRYNYFINKSQNKQSFFHFHHMDIVK